MMTATLTARIEQLIAASTAATATTATAATTTRAPQMARYLDELQRWNRAIRLIGRSDDDALLYHLADSLTVYPLLTSLTDTAAERHRRQHGAGTGGAGTDGAAAHAIVADVGSGNGMPGIPLALCMPQCDFQLIESSRKRCAFLQNVIALLELQNCTVICMRVEELARQQQRQGQGQGQGQGQRQGPWDVLLSRALTSWSEKLAAALAACLAVDGRAIIYANAQSTKSAEVAVALRSAFAAVERITVPISDVAGTAGAGAGAAADTGGAATTELHDVPHSPTESEPEPEPDSHPPQPTDLFLVASFDSTQAAAGNA